MTTTMTMTKTTTVCKWDHTGASGHSQTVERQHTARLQTTPASRHATLGSHPDAQACNSPSSRSARSTLLLSSSIPASAQIPRCAPAPPSRYTGCRRFDMSGGVDRFRGSMGSGDGRGIRAVSAVPVEAAHYNAGSWGKHTKRRTTKRMRAGTSSKLLRGPYCKFEASWRPLNQRAFFKLDSRCERVLYESI